MDITTIDSNFDTTFECPHDIEWHSIRNAPFSTYGVYFSEEEGLYRRMPKNIADATNEGVSVLSKHTAGGRIRFATNSPYVAVRVEEPFEPPYPHMTIEGKMGVSLFADKKFVGGIMPSYAQTVEADGARGGSGTLVFDGIKYPYGVAEKTYQMEIFLPLYSPVSAVYIGVKKDCLLQSAVAYQHTKPVLFYGSSITQGACASKSGDDYVNRLCRALDTDILNLGFSGNACGEQVMADYIAAQDASVFVLDYDHNAPTAEHLRNTHFPLYKTVRKANPTTPIIMMTKPTIEGYQTRANNPARRENCLFATAKSIRFSPCRARKKCIQSLKKYTKKKTPRTTAAW